MKICETQRLIIRQFSIDDVPLLSQILSDDKVMKYSVRGVCDEDATRDFISRCMACYVSYGLGPWALIDKSSNLLIGFCGVSPQSVAGNEEPNLGYRLAVDFWNKGLAYEAATSVLEYVFTQTAHKSVVVIIEPGHIASLKVAKKIGFTGYNTHEFHGRTVQLYRLTKPQWISTSFDKLFLLDYQFVQHLINQVFHPLGLRQ